MGKVEEHDQASGLVEREWRRTGRRAGVLTERTLEGEPVEAAFLDPRGGLHRAAGTVRRSASGELVVESWADGIRRQTAVPRDANVTTRAR